MNGCGEMYVMSTPNSDVVSKSSRHKRQLAAWGIFLERAADRRSAISIENTSQKTSPLTQFVRATRMRRFARTAKEMLCAIFVTRCLFDHGQQSRKLSRIIYLYFFEHFRTMVIHG